MSSVAELSREAMMLSVSDRVWLAQQIWESLDSAAMNASSSSEEVFFKAVEARDRELDSGAVEGIAHADVIAHARAALKCERSITPTRIAR